MEGFSSARARARSMSVTMTLVLGAFTLGAGGCKEIGSRSYLEDRPAKLNPVGERCSGGGSDTICLALHYVAYNDSSGEPVADAELAAENVRQVNEIFSTCGIAFQIDNYERAKPEQLGLAFNAGSFDEMDRARVAFAEKSTLLAVTTGGWTGALKSAGANAWTQPPQADVFGVVMEEPVADYPNILAHELGHYLDLDHVSDRNNLLNPVVYRYSREISKEQCQKARDAALTYWPDMRR